MKKLAVALLIFLMTSFLAVGYAQLTRDMLISGEANATPPYYDVYISNITPDASAGVLVTNRTATVMTARVSGAGTASFTITVKNQGSKTYVYERVIDGAEANIEGAYNGTAIKYEVGGIRYLDELGPGKSVTFTLTLTVPAGVTTDQYLLKFNFIEKMGTDILPDGETEAETTPESPETEPLETEPLETEPIETETETAPSEPETDGGMHNDFLGLVEALLSTQNNCLNNSNVIFNAVWSTIDAGKRPEEDAPILHCTVNSISGGTMTDVATTANRNLTAELQFFFEADPQNRNRMFLYMYYKSDCTASKVGESILTYLQVVSRDENGVWYADGTYKGQATVGYFYGGGNNGKDVLTVNAYSWTATAVVTASK